MKKRFKEILCDIHAKDCQQQMNVLNETLEDWMKDTDQIDDITVLGFKLTEV